MVQAPTKPVKVFRIRGISAAVFQNQSKTEGREVTYYRVNLQRTYKEGNEFKTSSSFGRDDLPVAEHVLRQAWEFILDAESNANNGG